MFVLSLIRIEWDIALPGAATLRCHDRHHRAGEVAHAHAGKKPSIFTFTADVAEAIWWGALDLLGHLKVDTKKEADVLAGHHGFHLHCP